MDGNCQVFLEDNRAYCRDRTGSIRNVGQVGEDWDNEGVSLIASVDEDNHVLFNLVKRYKIAIRCYLRGLLASFTSPRVLGPSADPSSSPAELSSGASGPDAISKFAVIGILSIPRCSKSMRDAVSLSRR